MDNETDMHGYYEYVSLDYATDNSKVGYRRALERCMLVKKLVTDTESIQNLLDKRTSSLEKEVDSTVGSTSFLFQISISY